MAKDDYLDTIVAIATPPGAGAVGIVRISGVQAVVLTQRLLRTREALTPRCAYFRRLHHPVFGETIDEAVVLFFKGPHSFTGEDVVELQTHGSMVVLRQLLSVLTECGARLAEPGEFTRRAFLNGKLSLDAAESVIDLIESTSTKSSQIALGRLKGKLYTVIGEIRAVLMRLLEQVEGSIDFPDEVEPLNRQVLRDAVSMADHRLGQVLAAQDFGQKVSEGISCVIVGQPNVGKSALLNAFCGESRAIVTAIAGTTRDFLTADIELGGLLFRLVDTAGIREGAGVVEKLGIRKVHTLLKQAHAVIWVVDRTRPFDSQDAKIFERIRRHRHVYILANKSDLKTYRFRLPPSYQTGRVLLDISAKKDLGL
ncbi:MAG: tRNA uridine-5-carboxymethylaminomethyl(34) synthesis GTPase MnmE, partial [Candidatus Margulisiibacteriota bacterium]